MRRESLTHTERERKVEREKQERASAVIMISRYADKHFGNFRLGKCARASQSDGDVTGAELQVLYVPCSMLCFYDLYTSLSTHAFMLIRVLFFAVRQSSIVFLFVAKRRRALAGCCVRYSRCISSIHAKNFTEFSRCMNE